MIAYLTKVQEFDEAIDRFRDRVEKENDAIYFEAVPAAVDPIVALPDGISVAKSIPFVSLSAGPGPVIRFDLGLVPETWSERVFGAVFE